MFRRLIILLGLLVTPAFGQEVPLTDPTQIPIVEQTYTFTQQQTPTPIQDVRDEGGTPLTLYDDGVSQLISLPFDFYFYGNLYDSLYISQNGFISFTNNANGCCSGNPLPYFTEWTEQNAQSYQYFSVNNSIFAMWSDLADFNNPGNPYYKATGNSFTAGWYNVDELGTANKFTFEISLFSDSSFSINYGAFNYAGATGRTFTSGYQGDQVGEFYQIYNGNNPSSLQNTTYFVQSSEIVPLPPPPPEEPIAPDCTINPYDPSCIINDITDPVDEPIMLADETTPIDEEEEDPVVEETFAAEETTETTEEEALEELLAENIDDEELVEDVMEESNAVYRELTDEEKAAILADAISKTTLESALSVTSAAETAAVTQSVVSEITATESSSRIATTLTIDEITSETTLSSIAGSSEMFIDSAKEELSSSESFAGADILEAGRQLGQAALNETLAATTESATDSMTQAESVALTSSSESQIIIAQTEASSPVETVAEEQSSTTEQTTTEQQQESVLEQQESTVLVAENEQQSSNETTAVIVAESNAADEIVTAITETPVEETIVADTQVASETQTESVEVVADNVQTEQSSVTYSDVESAMEVFASNLPTQITAAAEQEELENSIVQQAIASSQQTEDDNRMGFAEAEAVTIANDPALANAFNVQPNTASLELLGVLGSAGQDKSDAELRAEQVVAANKEEQDAINANYMEADQSGILAAIGSDTDVTAYRTAMLRDNNNWYKPEDIYKGVIIKDNVRGSYFLEKGNTDTYKKMVDEQYK